MKYYSETPIKVLEELKADEDGLTNNEITKRKEQYGENKITNTQHNNDIKEILSKPINIVLFICSIMSFLIKKPNDAIGILLVLAIAMIIDMSIKINSENSTDTLKEILEDVSVKTIRNGNLISVLRHNLLPGDIIYIETGDLIPADGRLIESFNLKVRQEIITGEAYDAEKRSEDLIDIDRITRDGKVFLKEPTPALQTNMVFNGSIVSQGRGKVVVTAIGDNTRLAKVRKSIHKENSKIPLQLKSWDIGVRLQKYYSIIVVFLLFITMITIGNNDTLNKDIKGTLDFLSLIDPIKNSIVIYVLLMFSFMPERLSENIDTMISIIKRKMFKINTLILKNQSCEDLGKITTICVDKTGILTKNNMYVASMFSNGKYISDPLQCDGYLKRNCILNSTTYIVHDKNNWQTFGSEIEGALLRYFKSTDYIKLREISHINYQSPFNSLDKKMSTQIIENDTSIILTKGMAEIILAQCKYELINNKVELLSEDRVNFYLEEIKKLETRGMKTLGFAYKDNATYYNKMFSNKKGITEESEFIFNGFVGILDPLREEVGQAIKIANTAGIQTKILTGDSLNTATAIGNQLDLFKDNMKIVTSTYIEKLSDKELAEEIDSISVISESDKYTKMRIVNILKSKNEIVGIVGDEIEDIPILSRANVGISKSSGAEVYKREAAVHLMEDGFSTIVKAIELSRCFYENFQRFIQFQVTSNLVLIFIFILSQIYYVKTPFTVVQMLWINVIINIPLMIAFISEPNRHSILEKKPVKKKDSIITKSMVESIGINTIYILLILFIQMRYNIVGIIGDANYMSTMAMSLEPNVVNTALFAITIFTILFSSFNFREIGHKSIFSNILPNMNLLKITLTIGFVQIFSIEFLGYIFGMAPLGIIAWIKILVLSFAIIPFSEGVKFFIRLTKLSQDNSSSTKNVIAK